MWYSHCTVEKREILSHLKNFLSNKSFGNFFNYIAFTKFLRKMWENFWIFQTVTLCFLDKIAHSKFREIPVMQRIIFVKLVSSWFDAIFVIWPIEFAIIYIGSLKIKDFFSNFCVTIYVSNISTGFSLANLNNDYFC